MNKIPACIFSFCILFCIFSCGREDIFQGKNSFNLDTLYANPVSGITENFQLIWEVSIEGYPQFLVDVYLSDDDVLDPGDLKIAGTADTGVSANPDHPYTGGLNFRLAAGPGGEFHFEYSHDQITWINGPASDEDYSGKTRHLIGFFYHPQGMLIVKGRTWMAVEIVFQ